MAGKVNTCIRQLFACKQDFGFADAHQLCFKIFQLTLNWNISISLLRLQWETAQQQTQQRRQQARRLPLLQLLQLLMIAPRTSVQLPPQLVLTVLLLLLQLRLSVISRLCSSLFDVRTLAVLELFVWRRTVGWPWFWAWGIESERLQVSYYELYYHRVCEIRRQNSHTAQTVNQSKFNENTQNVFLKVQSLRIGKWQK